jgi:hypothetical protein
VRAQVRERLRAPPCHRRCALSLASRCCFFFFFCSESFPLVSCGVGDRLRGEREETVVDL